jgi:hypothetical protein
LDGARPISLSCAIPSFFFLSIFAVMTDELRHHRVSRQPTFRRLHSPANLAGSRAQSLSVRFPFGAAMNPLRGRLVDHFPQVNVFLSAANQGR